MRLEVVSGGRYNVRREAAPFRTGLLSAPFVRDLAEIMAVINLERSVNQFFRDIRLASVAHKSCEICETMRAQAAEFSGPGWETWLWPLDID
jgi:hypothetical protein